MVSRARRVLFVHVQKTGGSTIDALFPHVFDDAERLRHGRWSRHTPLSVALAEHPELAGYFVFGFVRNPWARLYSWHAMIRRRIQLAESGNRRMRHRVRNNPLWHQVATQFPTFEAFVLEGTDRIETVRRPQLDYLRTPDRVADFIGRTERLEEDLRELWARLGVPGPKQVARRNAGPPHDYRVHYTAAMRDKVAEVYAADVETFGYRFDPA